MKVASCSLSSGASSTDALDHLSSGGISKTSKAGVGDGTGQGLVCQLGAFVTVRHH